MNDHPLPRLLEEPGVTGPQAKPDLVPGVPEPYPGAARSWLRREGRDKGIQLPAIVARGMDPAEGFGHCGDGLDPTCFCDDLEGQQVGFGG